MSTLTGKQRGITISGLLVWLVLLILAAIGAMKLIPAYIEYAQINKIFHTIAHDPELQGAAIKNVRDSYNKRAQIDNIAVIDAGDIDIVKDSSGLSLSASYQVKIPLVANINLLLDFNPNSSAQ